jgi:PAS domain-containing protein
MLIERFPALHGTELARRLRDAAGSDAPSEFEVRGPMQGRIVAIRAHAWEGGLVCCYRDVTAQREAEAALRASEEKYRSVFENSFDGFLLTRTTGEILTANPAACRMLGRTEAEIRAVGRAGVVDLTDPRLATLLAERAVALSQPHSALPEKPARAPRDTKVTPWVERIGELLRKYEDITAQRVFETI